MLNIFQQFFGNNSDNFSVFLPTMAKIFGHFRQKTQEFSLKKIQYELVQQKHRKNVV